MESVLRWENAVRWMEALLPVLLDGVALVLYYWVAVLLPLSFFRRMHPLIATMLKTSSIVIGGVCWWQSVIVTYRMLGWLCVVVGLALVGLGVVPMALAITAARGEWSEFGSLLATAALTLIPRYIAKSMTRRATKAQFAGRAKTYYADDCNT